MINKLMHHKFNFDIEPQKTDTKEFPSNCGLLPLNAFCYLYYGLLIRVSSARRCNHQAKCRLDLIKHHLFSCCIIIEYWNSSCAFTGETGFLSKDCLIKLQR